MKRLILPLIALGSLLFGIFSVARSQPVRARSLPPSPPPVSSYARTVAAVGLIETSSENIAVGTPLSDIVDQVFVKVGESVKTGEPLFKFDDRHLRADLLAGQADLGVAESQVRVNAAALADVNRQLGFAESLRDKSAISSEELARRRSAVETAEARCGESEARVAAAAARIEVIETQIERSTVRAPVDGEVLQVKVHPGEFAPAGVTSSPLVLLGQMQPLHIRVDVDEHEAWRVRAGARAGAAVRGNANLRAPLTFVRFEPFVVPKRSLTGDSTERVDTRVLQVIYRVDDSKLPLFVGQQMDVFIEAAPPAPSVSGN